MDSAAVSIASGLDSAGVTIKDIYRSKPRIDRTPKKLPTFNTEHDKHCNLYKRIFLTLVLFLLFVSTGFSGGVFGPTLVHLELLFNTGTKEIALAFVGSNVGYLGGSVVCAFMFDRLNHEIQFSLWSLVAGICVIILPFMPKLLYFYSLISFQFFALGIMYAGAQVYAIKLWVDLGYHKRILQACQLMWCLGNFLIPFIALPFLDDLPHDDRLKPTVEENEINEDISDKWNEWNTMNGMKGLNATNDIDQPADFNNSLPVHIKSIILPHFGSVEPHAFNVDKVRYVYVLVGIVTLVQAILFLIGFIMKGASCANKTFITDDKPNSNVLRKQSSDDGSYISLNKFKISKLRLLKLLMLCLLFTFILFHCWHRYVIGSFITTFTIKGLGWSTEKGALSTSVFYGFHTLGSLFGVLISKYISPGKLIMADQILTTAALALLMFSHIHDAIVWVGISIGGFVLATVFPSLILWTIDYMPINGQVGALFMTGSSIGGITSGMLVGYLFEQYTHMWMVYISLGSSILCMGLFVLLLCLGKCVKDLLSFVSDDTTSSDDVKEEKGLISQNSTTKTQNVESNVNNRINI